MRDVVRGAQERAKWRVKGGGASPAAMAWRRSASSGARSDGNILFGSDFTNDFANVPIDQTTIDSVHAAGGEEAAVAFRTLQRGDDVR